MPMDKGFLANIHFFAAVGEIEVRRSRKPLFAGRLISPSHFNPPIGKRSEAPK
jgi:hypothetical protein